MTRRAMLKQFDHVSLVADQKNPTEVAATTLTVERGLQVLRAFRAESSPLGNADLVRRTGLSKATVSRITSTLRRLGFITQVRGGRKFQVGTRALSLGHAYVEVSPTMKTAQPFMQKLADRLNVSVALAVGDQLDMLYVAYCKSARIATLHFGVGTVLPMALTSIGRAYVWALPANQRQARLAAIVQQAGKDGAAIKKRFSAAFGDLERVGYCLSVGEYQRDAYGVAVPLRVGREQTLMALACGAAALGLDPDKLRQKVAPEVQRAAQELRRILANVDCTP